MKRIRTSHESNYLLDSLGHGLHIIFSQALQTVYWGFVDHKWYQFRPCNMAFLGACSATECELTWILAWNDILNEEPDLEWPRLPKCVLVVSEWALILFGDIWRCRRDYWSSCLHFESGLPSCHHGASTLSLDPIWFFLGSCAALLRPCYIRHPVPSMSLWKYQGLTSKLPVHLVLL